MLEKNDVVFSTNDIDVDIDSNIATFLSDGMDLVTIDLNNINLDDYFDEDDPETLFMLDSWIDVIDKAT